MKVHYKEVISNILITSFIVRIGKRQMRVFLFCHGLPDRCPTFFGYKSPLCYRCVGLILGITPVLFYHASFSDQLLTFLFVIFVSPILVDGFTQNLGLRESNNLSRLVTGFMGGLGLFFFLSILFKY
ncbi:MAG: DUF2085 domain-containing protein [Candidatus Bathyarchaeota archaeon]|nr:DUF2085 domain-containing protein [Candidatus Bathyarchaeota archaeon]